MRKIFVIIMLAIFMMSYQQTGIFAASSGRIVGVVKDAATRQPLPGANVYLVGTAMGAASDLKGNYRILRVPPGLYTLKVTFIGYKEKEVSVRVLPGETKEVNLELQFGVVKGKAVVVTAQAEGQVAAINQQLRSNTIKNVVSAERIRELPDANAAESVGRLPGISIIRSGGEANKVVIRGLAPTYNSITVDNQRIPATDLDDRGVDLSMISPDILAGIEVTKALTPDMDADAIGGTVNFKLADAPSGGFRYHFRFYEGYNDLRREPGQYKGSFTLSNRYWNERFGLMVNGDVQRVQRGSDDFTADYFIVREKREGEQFAPISVGKVNLRYVDEVRRRYGFNVIMDYKLPNGKIMLTNFMSRLDRNEKINTNQFDGNNNWHKRLYEHVQPQIDVLNNSLTGEYRIRLGTVDWRLSRSASLNRHPFDNSISFMERSAFDHSLLPNFFGPNQLISAANNNLDNTSLYNGHFYTEKSFDRHYTAKIDFKMPYTFTSKIAGYLKFGGKYVGKYRDRKHGICRHRLDIHNLAFEKHHTEYENPHFDYKWLSTGSSSIYNYIDSGFDAGKFLNGAYNFGIGLNGNELDHLLKVFLLDSLYQPSTSALLDDYEVAEDISAGYIMSEINFGRFLMFLPGIRYEYTHADMTGRKGTVTNYSEPQLNNPFVTDTTAISNYGNWFPMFQTRIRPIKWFDIRLAYTKSLSRPRLDWMIPEKKVFGASQRVKFGRPDLKPQISSNYDIFLSLYSNHIGLFTLGGFFKDIRDLIFYRSGHIILNAEKEGFSHDLQGFTLERAENNPFLTKVKGLEVEWQTNFHWLPSPLDGIVLNANYSHIWSKTHYPRSFVKQEKINVFPFLKTTVCDTFRTGRMLDQANDIANIAIGYDKGPFSARLSMLYQGNTLSSVGERPELDGFTADLLRWDLSIKYRIGKYIGIFWNWNNITNEPDESFQQVTRYPTAREFYGLTTDLGIGYSF